MKRTSLFLDEKLLRQLKQVAYKRGISVAAVVREAMAAYVTAPPRAGTLPSVAARFSSGRRDTATRADTLLWKDPHK